MPMLRSIIALTTLSMVVGQGSALAFGPPRGNLLGAHQNISGLGSGEYIVSSQVISDEVVGGATSANGIAGGEISPPASGFVGDMSSGNSAAGCVPRTYGYPDLFYNNYTQGNCNATNAQMYISPVPVPPHVGHTFNTYQPWYPEEMLYWHTNRYHNYYDGGRGMNHTKVHYYAPPVRTAWSNLYWNKIRIPR
jgi:hypothetical protein